MEMALTERGEFARFDQLDNTLARTLDKFEHGVAAFVVPDMQQDRVMPQFAEIVLDSRSLQSPAVIVDINQRYDPNPHLTPPACVAYYAALPRRSTPLRHGSANL
jgi:hypothetical protein